MRRLRLLIGTGLSFALIAAAAFYVNHTESGRASVASGMIAADPPPATTATAPGEAETGPGRL